MKPEALLKDYSLALDQLVEALAIKADHDVVRAGCIQYFEFTFELAWKTIKAVAEQEGLGSVASPKACLKVAYAQMWIDNEGVWLEMLEARNRMSHTYDAQEALKIYARLPAFIDPFCDLRTALAGLS
jgi:nucleotidyltransferase substrate binding protein (TIGR01987 family)